MPVRLTARKLTASPNFALCRAADGSAYVVGEVEPYAQFWLTEHERLLFAIFGGKGGMTVENGVSALLALRPGRDAMRERRRAERAIAEMVEAGVLIEPAGELSRYGRNMARAYLRHRPFPTAIAADITEAVGLNGQARVLDLASGPGSLALELARTSSGVSIMELSRGFVLAARAEARRRGVQIHAINESCNRLAQHDGTYDLITISQALHWLDDIAVCRGVCRTLAPGGSFVVIHAAMNLPEHHPLAWVLGDRTPLGDKAPISFPAQVAALYRRLSLLFEAFDSPEVERHDPFHVHAGSGAVVPVGIDLYRQARPFDEGFARAFLSESHIAATGLAPETVWERIGAGCRNAAAEGLAGSMDWAVLRFQRGAGRVDPAGREGLTPREIAFP